MVFGNLGFIFSLLVAEAKFFLKYAVSLRHESNGWYWNFFWPAFGSLFRRRDPKGSYFLFRGLAKKTKKTLADF